MALADPSTIAPDTAIGDHLVEVIAAAIRAGDAAATDHALRLLAVEDPRRADDVLTVMRAGLVLARAAR